MTGHLDTPSMPDHGTVRAKENLALLDQIETERARTFDEARPERVARQHARGKLTARERIERLTDKDSFNEFGGLILPTEPELADREIAPADASITGTANIDGRPIVLTATDFMTAGGSGGVTSGRKLARVIDLAVQRGHPLIHLSEGGGHRIQGGLDAGHFGAGSQNFYLLSQLSGWVPTATALLGPSFAGPAVHAGVADFVVLVRGLSSMGVAGPPLVKAALGIDFEAEELGGADLQARNGAAHLVVDTEDDAFDAIRQYLSYFPSNAQLHAPISSPAAPDPAAAEGLLGAVPANPRVAYDVREVIYGICDANSSMELQPTHAPNLVTCLARIDGRPVGFIANQPRSMAGTLNGSASDKSARFISLCDAFGLPLIFLIDTPGYLVGPDAEKEALTRRGARPLLALAQATVPRISIVLRKGYGLAYLAMCGGRSFNADLAVAWPTAEISAMGVPGAVDIAYRNDYMNAESPDTRRQELIDHFTSQTRPIRAAETFGLDDVIDPRETRTHIIHTLAHAPARRAQLTPPRQHTVDCV